MKNNKKYNNPIIVGKKIKHLLHQVCVGRKLIKKV
jgi:hypothetical protein